MPAFWGVLMVPVGLGLMLTSSFSLFQLIAGVVFLVVGVAVLVLGKY